MPQRTERSLELPFTDRALRPAGETLHTIVLHDRIVPYSLRRSRRRSIGLSIDERGLRVGAPLRAALSEIEALICRHGDWVAQKLDEWRARRRPPLQAITDGATVSYLGGMLRLHLMQGGNQIRWEEQGAGALKADDTREDADSLHADGGAPHLILAARTPDDAARLLERALRRRAMAIFRERLAHFARQFGLPVPPLALSAARTRWGSCSLRTGIRLNWRLIHYRQALIDYVIIHELAHLREMNHSARFWAIVERYCPNYRQLREELKRLPTRAP